MAVYIDRMATSTSVATTLTAMTGSPYSPLVDGRLKQVIVIITGDAVTSLIEGGRVRLTSASFGVQPIDVPFAGANIRTAPAFPIAPIVVDVDQAVKTSVPIVCQVQHTTGATPVTPQIHVFGVFEGPLAA